jgi:hypothetical protein
MIGLLVFVAHANRQDVYIGSDESVDLSSGIESAFTDNISAGNEYVTATTYVETHRILQDFYWGYRYFVTFFIRPIPRQIWPTKYEDMGADWVNALGNDGYNATVYALTGVSTLSGASTGSIADGYAEFSWGVIPMFVLLGWAFSYIWSRHRSEGGYWTVLLFLMLALSVYLPTQSFSAWMVRAMFAGIGSLLFWRLVIGRTSFTRVPRQRRAAGPFTRS